MGEEQVESILNTEVNVCFALDKDYAYLNEDLRENDNFLIIDVEKLEDKIKNKKGLDPKDNFTIINTGDNLKDECIIKKNIVYKKKIIDLRLGVLYRCHEPDRMSCNIEENDKLQFTSYRLHYFYRGYSIDHQNPEKPLQILE